LKNKDYIPPKRALKFLRWFCREDYLEEIEGDLLEIFQSQAAENPKRAKRRFTWNVVKYFRPEFIKSFASRYQTNTKAMFRHNFIISFRNFQRHKMSFIINLIGLSTGLACALLIYIWATDELGTDKFHVHGDRLYQLTESQQLTGNIRTTNSTPWLLAESLKQEMPEVEYAAVVTPFYWYSPFTLTVGEKNIRARGVYSGTDFFNIFSYKLKYGEPSKVLTDKNSVVISEDVALGLFGRTENIIGKAIEFQHEREFLIAGIFEDVPANSSVKFDMVLSVDVLKDTHPDAFSWENSGPFTYVMLKEGASRDSFSKKIANYIGTKTESKHRLLSMVRYDETYLADRISYVRLFSLVAAFILLIACINFMNLATARASRRMKEVGIKKAVGAFRSSLIFQYLTESILVAFIALPIAGFITFISMPQFNQITGKNLTIDLNYTVLGAFAGITLLTGLLAGSYPAMYLSGFKPISILKGIVKNNAGELWVRKGMVVFQFTLSVVFIMSVIVIYKQIEYVQTQNLGFNKNNVAYFDIEGKIRDNLETFLSELREVPGVKYASSAGESLIGGGNTSPLEWEGKDPETRIPFAVRPANYDLPEMMELQFTEGRSYSRAYNDSMNVIFNEAGIKAMGMEDPVGKTVKLGPYTCTIIGVIENYHFESFHSTVAPLLFVFAPEHTEKVMVKIEEGKTMETLAKIKDFYAEFNPGFGFDYRFIDQDYQNQYEAEQRIGTLSKYFGGLAILISCLGLLGLAAFTAERRTKEIGIRKIMGSSVFDIVRLLSADFTKMVLLAVGIALPISFFIAKDWLNDFAYRIDLEWWYFVGAGMTAMLIAWLTVGFQTVKAARINPIDHLRSE
jgi:putative ABC transport system permease protein